MSPVLEHLRRRPGSSLDPTVGLWGDQDGGKDAGRHHVPGGVTRRGGLSPRQGDRAAAEAGVRLGHSGISDGVPERGSRKGHLSC